jgi:hypothetical protein
MVIAQGWRRMMNELERLREQHRRLRKEVDCDRLEFYHRSSHGIRIELEESEQRMQEREGSEQGVAVRMPSGFAAASGSDDNSLRWAIDRAKAGRACSRERNRVEGGGELQDHDETSDMPAAAQLHSWLEKALDLLPVRPLRAWVETAKTIESLVADGGLAASRSRCRAWAMAWVKQRPLIIASRRWKELPEQGWADLAVAGSGESVGSPILFTADSAAKLVSALVRSFHDDESRIGEPVGPGWRLVDDPASPDALFGGSFDDGAFRTKRRLLADGERVCGAISGPGNLLRPSFRDPPQPLPSHLVVESLLMGPPDDHYSVSELTIHPLSPGEWALQVGDGLIMTGPGELIRNCVAGIGAPRLAHNGVMTPALLFEGLRVRR